MNKHMAGVLRVVSLAMLALVCLGAKLASTTSLSSHGKQVSSGQNDKPFDQARALGDLRKSMSPRPNQAGA